MLVRYGEAPSQQPADPEKEHFVFKDWFTDEALENPVNWNLPVYRSTTYYAKWSISADYLTEQLRLVKIKSDASTKAVNNCKYLSETQMAEYNATISQAVKDANAGIRNAQSVEEVEAIQQNLDSSLLPTVKEALDKELTICTDTNKEDIASANYMTENYINTTNGLVDEASEAGHSQIEVATTISDIVAAKISCESTIETYKTQTLTFSESKSNALTELQTFADTNIATIDGLTDYLSAAERATYKESITKENNDGNDKVKNEVDFPAELSPVVSATEAAITEIATNAQNLNQARGDAITTANAAASGMIKALSDSSS